MQNMRQIKETQYYHAPPDQNNHNMSQFSSPSQSGIQFQNFENSILISHITASGT